MSNIVDAIRTTLGEGRMNHEHSTQIKLVDLLCSSVEQRLPPHEVGAVIDQLVAYTGLHFLSEQLIMRQHEFGGHEQHATAHNEILEHLREMQARLNRSQENPSSEEVQQARAMILGHIAEQDRQLHNHITAQRLQEKSAAAH